MIVTLYFACVLTAWAFVLRSIVQGFSAVFDPAAHPGRPEPPSLPPLSIVIPARNEEENLPGCLSSLTGDDYPLREVVVADDGSTDKTREIAESIPGVRRIDVAPSMKKITGKMNAMEQGAARAGGSWLLFLDADAAIQQGTLRASILYAEARGADLMSLSPHQDCETFWEEAVQPSVFTFFNILYPYSRVNNPSSSSAAANGVFLLVRREAFEKIGRFSWAEGRLAEDTALAGRMKSLGYRILFLPTHSAVSVRMYRGLSDLWQGWSKHFETFFGGGGIRAVLVPAGYFFTFVCPFLLASVTPLHWFPLTVLIALYLMEAWMRRMQGYRALYAVFLPLGNIIFFGILVNSLINRYVRKRVVWKGRVYGG